MALLDFRAICFPYCLRKNTNGSYNVLNREYKPIGFDLHHSISGEDLPSTFYKGITPKFAEKISWKNDPDLNFIFLYHDGINPLNSAADMKVYLEKLALLGKLKARR